MTPVVGANPIHLKDCHRHGHWWRAAKGFPQVDDVKDDTYAIIPGEDFIALVCCARCGGAPRPSSELLGPPRCAICTKPLPPRPPKDPDAPRDAHQMCLTNAREYLRTGHGALRYGDG